MHAWFASCRHTLAKFAVTLISRLSARTSAALSNSNMRAAIPARGVVQLRGGKSRAVEGINTQMTRRRAESSCLKRDKQSCRRLCHVLDEVHWRAQTNNRQKLFQHTEQKPTYIFHCLFLRMLVFETTVTFSLIFAFHTLNGVILSSCKGKKNNLEIQI